MKKLNDLLTFVAAIVLLSCGNSSSGSKDAAKTDDASGTNSGEIKENAFLLSQGKIYSYNFAQSKKEAIDIPGDSIMKFFLSPSKQFIAYEVLLKTTPIILEENEIEGYNHWARIIVYDLKNKKIIQELLPQEADGLALNGWIGPETVFFDEASIGGALDLCSYSIGKEKPVILDFDMETELRSTTLSPDGTMTAFADKNTALHIVNLANNKDSILLKKSDGITDIAFSDDNAFLAWLDVTGGIQNTLDKVFVLNFRNNLVALAFEADAEAKTTTNALHFSTDTNFISIEIDFKIHVVNLSTGKLVTINGYNPKWISADEFAYLEESKDMYLYNISSGERSLLEKYIEQIEVF